MSSPGVLGSTWPGEETLSPEIRALLACARAVTDESRRADFGRALGDCPSADAFCEAAVAHGMLGHVHRVITLVEPGMIDPNLAMKIGDLQRISAQRSLRQAGYLVRMLEALDEAGVDAMPFKGPTLAERLYGDVTLRSWVDLDMLVPHEQVPLAREVLLAGGFVDGNPFNEKIGGRRRRGWGEVALQSADGYMMVELHWEATVGFSARSLQADALLSRADRLLLMSREVLVPAPVDQVLMACLHGTRHRWDKVEELLGLAIQVRDMPAGRWPAVMDAAGRAGCRRRVAVGVAHVCRLFALPLADEVSRALAGDVIGRRLLRSLTPDTLDRDAAEGSRRELEVHSWTFASEDSVAAGLWHGAIRLFRPGPEDWGTVPLPARLGWLYYLLRPPRLAIKWARRLF